MGAGSAYKVLSTCKDINNCLLLMPLRTTTALFPPELGTGEGLLIPHQHREQQPQNVPGFLLSHLKRQTESKSLLPAQPLQMVPVVMLPLPGDAEEISCLSIC